MSEGFLEAISLRNRGTTCHKELMVGPRTQFTQPMSDLLASEINSLCIRSEELLNGKHKNSAQLQAELREMFRRTKQLLTEMMDHNEELRNNNRYLKQQRLELEQRFEDIRLGIKNRQLKAEQSFLNSQLKDLENKTRKYHRRLTYCRSRLAKSL